MLTVLVSEGDGSIRRETPGLHSNQKKSREHLIAAQVPCGSSLLRGSYQPAAGKKRILIVRHPLPDEQGELYPVGANRSRRVSFGILSRLRHVSRDARTIAAWSPARPATQDAFKGKPGAGKRSDRNAEADVAVRRGRSTAPSVSLCRNRPPVVLRTAYNSAGEAAGAPRLRSGGWTSSKW